MKTTKQTLLLFAALSVAACSQSTTTQNPPDNSVRATTWNWVSSSGGFRGGVQTPETLGYHQFYVLRTDSTLSFVRTPDSNRASWNGAYQIWRAFYPITLDTQFMMRFYIPKSSEPAGTIARLQYHGTDTILIGEDAADGIIETYVRAK